MHSFIFFNEYWHSFILVARELVLYREEALLPVHFNFQMCDCVYIMCMHIFTVNPVKKENVPVVNFLKSNFNSHKKMTFTWMIFEVV